MSEALKHTIEELLRESRSFNRNDVLVHADSTSKKLLFVSELHLFSKNDFPNRILKEAKNSIKESGVNTLCLAEGFLINGENRSPILLTPLSFKEDKVRNQIEFIVDENGPFLNPYIEYLLAEKEIRDTLSADVSAFESLRNFGFEIEDQSEQCIGNFHHHRYSVLKELEELLVADAYSDPLLSVFGHKSSESNPIDLPKDILLPADSDHETVFTAFEENQLVIQGPPGTGKSQVLTNLVAKLLSKRLPTLVLSEKHAALEVILQKLQDFGLHRLGYIATSDNDVHAFLEELQKTWNFFEQETIEPVPNVRLSEQYEDQLQFSLDVLNQPNAVGGISLYDFKQLANVVDLNDAIFVSNPTEVDTYLRIKPIVDSVYDASLERTVGMLSRECLQRNDFTQLEPKINTWIDDIKLLKDTVHFETWSQFLSLMKQAALCQILENDLYKQHSELYKPNSRAQKKFLKLRSKYHALQKEFETVKILPSHWILEPSEEELNFLLKLNANSSWSARFKFKKHWKKYSRLPASEAEIALRNYQEVFNKITSKSNLLIEFCDLGIEDPEKEMEIIYTSIHQLGEEQWKILSEIPLEKRAILTQNHTLISDCYHALKSCISPLSETPILSVLSNLKSQFGTLVSMHQELLKLDDICLQLFRECESSEQHYASILHSHWMLFKRRFQTLSQFEMSNLKSKATASIESQSSEARAFAISILKESQIRFEAFHELLNTPARKLSEGQKELKKRLKRGKSILVKEFAKTRSHPSMRELFASEAREWIQLLKPIWLSNPTQIAKSFPLETDLFDVVIFDEASQIPVQNALGALQRSKRGVIAGDSQQMGPTAYFRAGSSEVMDLLHQASFYWKGTPLKHHYRSVHPDLIAFSNQHFYNGELKAFPAYGASNPIQHYFIEGGIFDQRRNTIEAEAVANHIQSLLKSTNSIGVVAFSEEQLQAIWEELDIPTQRQITTLTDSGEAFFKALENVQGDECDHLVISFGYAKSPEGEFAMRFGPMNTANGRRRLNVLLTRARKSFDFFSSVSYEDFKLSDNESVNLLRLWFAKLESHQATKKEIQLPFDAKFTIDGNQLTLFEPHKYLGDARELITFQHVMQSRGWEIFYA